MGIPAVRLALSAHSQFLILRAEDVRLHLDVRLLLANRLDRWSPRHKFTIIDGGKVVHLGI